LSIATSKGPAWREFKEMGTVETTEEISAKPEVRQALSQTSGPKPTKEPIKAETKDKFWYVTHVLLLVGCAALCYPIGSKLIPVPQNVIELARRFLRGAVLVVIALAIAKAVSIYVIGRLDDAATRFTLRRILHLIVVLVIAVIVIGVVFVNWYTALISVGIGSGRGRDWLGNDGAGRRVSRLAGKNTSRRIASPRTSTRHLSRE
jgi:hypothetical protein